MKTVAAIYDNGVFRPLEKINIPESSQVSVVVPDAPIRPALAAIYDAMSFRFDSGQPDTTERHNEHQLAAIFFY